MRWPHAGEPLGPSSYIGPFRVVAQIHTGQYSVIYRCYDSNLGRQVAVKAVRPDSIGPMLARRQLWREAHLRALLDHPHVLPLYRLVRARTGPLLVGPWLTGGTLHDRIRYPMPPAMVLAVVEQIADALDAAANSGWWHGDVSPTNVLFTAPGKAGVDAPARVMLSDFGISRRHGERPRGRGGLVMTPQVTAPEVWDDQPVDASSDLYGLGVLLYLALTGEYPFGSDDLDTFAYLHRHAAVPPPSDRSSVAGPATDEVVLRALAKAPSARFATGGALAAALHKALRADGQLHRRARDSNDEPELHSRGDWRSRSSLRPIEMAAISGAAEHLDHFAAVLDLRERAALRLLVARAGVSEAHGAHETELLTMKVFAPAAALRALEETGAAVVLADGPCTAAETARACGAPESTIPRVLRLLAALGIIRRIGDRYSLPLGLATACRGDRLAGFPLGPISAAARFWEHLPRWAVTGEPFTKMDRPDGAIYSHATSLLGILSVAAARELATALRMGGYVPAGAAVLDVGAGSGVWSIAVATTNSGVTITALDREQVLATTRAHVAAAGLMDRLHTLPGDWRDAPLPVAAFDIALLGNVCHLEPEAEVLRLLHRVHTALRPDGALVIIDTIPDQGEDLGAVLQDLHVALRTPGGSVHARASYVDWLEQAGFRPMDALRLRSTAERLTALISRRRNE